MRSTAPPPARRRKRARSANDENRRPQQSKPWSASSRSIPHLDDSSLTFLDNSGDFLSDRIAVLSSVPILLEERRSGKWSGRPKAWQQRSLKKYVKKPESGCPRRQWRSYAKRSIPFTRLGTPPSDAVLALDRQGSFVLSLGSKGTGRAPLALALRFYGILSPAVEQSRTATASGHITAPLLHTTPLLYDVLDQPPAETIFNFRRGVSPATTPVSILVANDWRMGVTFFQPSNVWREEGPVGTLVLFSLGNRHPTRSTMWQCTNVRIGTGSSIHRQNLLWQVQGIPQVDETDDDPCIRSIHNIPGYLLLNDEEDGFRLTWASDDWGHQADYGGEITETPLVASLAYSATVFSFEKTWERFDADPISGERLRRPTRSEKSVGISVTCEAFLHIDALLSTILERRKGMSSESHPDFLYNLISITHAGRIAELIVVFLRKQRPGSLGVFVRADLYTGRFQELDWVKNTGARDITALQRWCDALALNRRMKELRSGPYAVKASHAIDWSKLCQTKGIDADETDNYNSSFWKSYVESREAISTRKPPKLVTVSSLYPDCDMFTNKAITDCVPVSSIQAKDSPSDLVYG